ncbi:TldD/PmbA family protein [Anthocerotibacter panamensis]|uniref:TldD/PmbA family protein n=1 Tax=Anthocerotibacter panamensis TaxID=2857077 RepID=UPI001FD9527F|nr:TldD/PmbA family protein [Anthocerotibacter panamensis]
MVREVNDIALRAIDKVLDLAQHQGAEAEVFYLEQAQTPIEFEANRLKSLQTKAEAGLALRLIHQGRLGFASSTDLERPESLVEAALQTASIGDPAALTFAGVLPELPPEVDSFEPPTTQALVTKGQELIAQLRIYNPDLLVSADFTVNTSTRAVATSNGAFYQQSAQTVAASLGANWVRGEDLLNIYSYSATRSEEPDYQALLTEIQTKLTWATSTATVSGGTLPVIFTPRAVASVFGGLLRTIFSGQSVVQKSSPLADKVGEHLFDPRLTVYEDPTQGVGRRRVDDEGTATQTKALIENGVVKGFYWDRTWAQRAGCAPTGNGLRGGLGRPTPRLVNLCITPGDATFAQMVNSLKEGIIVDQVLGAGQSNQLAGEFSVNLDLGYKVEHGEIVGRVKNTMVAGNLFIAGQALEVIGSEPEWVFGASRVPPLLFRQLGVASRDR